MTHLQSIWQRFVHNRDGAVAMFFALSAVGVIGGAAVAIDFARGHQARAQLIAAADSAALAGARTFGTASQREAIARQVFEANVQRISGIFNVTMGPENMVTQGQNSGMRVRASADIPTLLGQIFGTTELGMSHFAEAQSGIRTPTEVVMVLDTTYSMTGWKMSTLKDAGTRLVDELAASAATGDPSVLKFGVVPFSQYVNIGMGNRSKPWMDVPSDATWTTTNCSMQTPVIGWINCVQVWVPPQPPSPPGTCYNDGVPYSCGGGGGHSGYFQDQCQPVYGTPQNVCSTHTHNTKWHGCAGSRNYPLNTQDGGYATRIPGIMDVTCGSPILELTSSTSSTKSSILGLTPNGETYVPSGLIWGWRMLSARTPLEARANTPSDRTRKFLILMTDGLNTKSPNYPQHEGSDGALSNQLMTEICQNIAADTDSQITIYSVAFDVSDAATKNILRNCATATNGQFFDAQNATQFLAAFAEISAKVAELRLTK